MISWSSFVLVNFTGKCLSSSSHTKHFVIMRKKSIICLCKWHNECVNMFSTTIFSSGNNLGSTCMLYYSWISSLFEVHLFLNQSLWNCISIGHFWKTGFQLYGPQRKPYSRKPWTDVTRSDPLNIIDMSYITLILQLLFEL